MVRKKMEGDEEQRRAAARDAERAGEQPSDRGATTGGSKQRAHMRTSTPHEEKTASLHRGKQQTATGGTQGSSRADASSPARSFTGRGRQDYSEAHERVFEALVTAQEKHGGEGVHAEEIARSAGLPAEETRAVLHDLSDTHGVVSELQGADTPDLGPRYETRPGL
ncbi:hypothetical protein [Streptomyces kurssanovii]|uniref:Replication protein A C-terminal domain-containing protein n=1 Tax=Streptomyces kurssanovii TaxID=67312 RepID=A0ABV3HPS7_9ACTN